MSPEVQLLSRWAAGAQLATVALIAAFFVLLARTIRLQEVRAWAAAWVADAAALAALFAASLPGTPAALFRLGAAIHVAGKTAFALLFVAGARAHVRPGAGGHLPVRLLTAAAGGGLALGALVRDPLQARVAAAVLVGAALTAGAVWTLTRPPVGRSRWLGIGMLPIGAFFLHWVPITLPSAWGTRPLPEYARHLPTLNAVADLALALAAAVVIEGVSSQHLEHINRELLASQERLRLLVDLDPLTSLSNRRRLRSVMTRVAASGAAVIFLDVDDFKEINDRYGHIVGDACLLRVAGALTWAFRSDDALFRLGGDEFLVVAPGLDAGGARERVDRLRAELAEEDGSTPACRLSVGIAALPTGGEPDAALREADERMYDDKRAAKGARVARRVAVPDALA